MELKTTAAIAAAMRATGTQIARLRGTGIAPNRLLRSASLPFHSGAWIDVAARHTRYPRCVRDGDHPVPRGGLPTPAPARARQAARIPRQRRDDAETAGGDRSGDPLLCGRERERPP